jgi:hypothetical protein
VNSKVNAAKDFPVAMALFERGDVDGQTRAFG